MKHPLFVGLAALAAVLAATAALEVELLSEAPETPLPFVAAAVPETVTGRVAADPDRLLALEATILARPLFEASRRPPEQKATATAGASGPSLPRLAGIIVGPAGRSVIFAGPTGGRALVVAEGGSVGDYHIQSIGTDQVVLISGDASLILRPSFDPNPPTIPRALASLSAVNQAVPTLGLVPPGRITLPGPAGKPVGAAP